MGNDRAKTVISGSSDEQTQSESKRFGERRRLCETFRRSAENNKFTVSLGVPVPRIVAIRDNEDIVAVQYSAQHSYRRCQKRVEWQEWETIQMR